MKCDIYMINKHLAGTIRFGPCFAKYTDEVQMENVIVYMSQLSESKEWLEYFRNLGYEPLLTDQRSSLLSAFSKGIYSKVYLEISNFSGILLIGSIKEINKDANIVLIVKPGLDDIIGVLQNQHYQVINSITNLSNRGHDQ